MKHIKKITILTGLCLGLAGGIFYLDSVDLGESETGHVVGALGPGSQYSTPVTAPGFSPAGWVSCGGGPDDQNTVHVLDESPAKQRLILKFPGFYRENVTIGGRKSTRIDVDGWVKVMEAGMPELPVTSISLLVPDGGRTYIKVVEEIVREFKMDPVEPSTGHLPRNIDPSTVIPEFSDFYESGDSWPKEAAELGASFTVRGYEGVTVRLNPLRYDAGKGALVASEYLVVDVVTVGGQEKSAPITAADDPMGTDYNRVYSRLFANYTEPVALDKYERIQTGGRMLIISHDAFLPSLEGFATWKRQRGIDVTMTGVSELGGTSAGISQAIRDMYAEPEGLTWVILVGDKAEVPTMIGLSEGADSDSRYSMVAGGDIYPDLFISRISASDPVQVLTQVNRFISYEKNPQTGSAAAWYSQAVGIASDEGDPTDFSRADLLRDDLMNYGFTSVAQVYQGLGGTTAQITSALENGCSLVNYLGHGSGYSWGSVAFSITDVNNLDNPQFWPWIIDVACANGQFDIDTCFAEAWLRAGTPDRPTGAVAMIAATSDAPWVPPTVMQAEAVDLLVAEEAFSIGSLYYSGLMRVLDLYAGLDVAQLVLEQNVIFGDCSLVVRTRAPEEFLVAADPVVNAGSTTWTLEVDGPAGSIVTLTSLGMLHGMGVVTAQGVAEVSLTESVDALSALTLTVTGFNMVPHIENIPVLGGSGDSVSPEPEPNQIQPARVALLGNYPNPFNPQTAIRFELPRDMRVRVAVYDVRGSLVRELLNEVTPAGSREVLWDGRDTGGRMAASGVYLYQLTTADGNLTGRMMLAK